MTARHTDFDLRQTATQNRHSHDWPRMSTFVAYWGMTAAILLFLLLYILFGGNAPRHIGQNKVSDGTATVNNQGTVTLWTDRAEAVTGLDRKQMLGNEVFFAIPESHRVQIRKCFERSLGDDRLYPWPKVSFPGAGGEVQLTFRRESDHRIEAVFSR